MTTTIEIIDQAFNIANNFKSTITDTNCILSIERNEYYGGNIECKFKSSGDSWSYDYKVTVRFARNSEQSDDIGFYEQYNTEIVVSSNWFTGHSIHDMHQHAIGFDKTRALMQQLVDELPTIAIDRAAEREQKNKVNKTRTYCFQMIKEHAKNMRIEGAKRMAPPPSELLLGEQNALGINGKKYKVILFEDSTILIRTE